MQLSSYGLIGCGRFGQFCVQALANHSHVRPLAVADGDAEAAQRLAAAFGLQACSPAELLQRVDLVHIATPPATHFELARQALEAGVAVLCEKPLALSVADCDQLLALARAPLGANHLLRFNPLVGLVEQILASGVLGQPLHAFFENYAQDEHLGPQHWFWDRSLSGGIFLEHAVHFFDLHRLWFGPGEILQAVAQTRPGTDQQDRVFSLARHGQVLVTSYHGFDQPARLDRADHRILCQRGQLELLGWIPMKLRATGLTPDQIQSLTALAKLPPQASDDQLVWRLEVDRSELYASMFCSLVSDLLGPRRLTAEDAREAVRLSEAATRTAEMSGTVGHSRQ
ncbi:MAG: Gfo/Idh/MocA family protein [Vulcanimicrobiota bacterium]